MGIEKELFERSGSACELCGSGTTLQVYAVEPGSDDPGKNILVCLKCHQQIVEPVTMDANHWRCLNTSMWSAQRSVQVMAWRLLNRLRHEGWTQDLLDMLYLDDETLSWAQAGIAEETHQDTVVHKDSNGSVLQKGDTVVLVKDLAVKGGGFTAKRGTAVRNISLVADNPGQIEGRVNGQQVVILTQFVKKAN